MKILALIPARGGSRRLPGKNVRPFLGRPLVQWSVRFARELGVFERVLVSTDDEGIARCAQEAGGEVPFLRSAELASDTASSSSVAIDVLQREQAAGRAYDWVALLQPTSPLRDAVRWHTALALARQGACDAIVGVSPARDHPHHVLRLAADDAVLPWDDAAGLRQRTQDLPPAVRINGSLYLVRASVLLSQDTFFPAATRGIVCDQPWEGVDIDTEADWVVAEALARHYGRQG
ncbi:MAG: acylneuraminate cytidylyltransferase family protein [Ramlibacter sp.]|jgi:N-acylneuraminate cytidylyltransferase|nr:acylneuraminate cytidylyltransferase family protein [Ramlibacter sp.]